MYDYYFAHVYILFFTRTSTVRVGKNVAKRQILYDENHWVVRFYLNVAHRAESQRRQPRPECFIKQ